MQCIAVLTKIIVLLFSYLLFRRRLKDDKSAVFSSTFYQYKLESKSLTLYEGRYVWLVSQD